MPIKDMATSTSTFVFIRYAGNRIHLLNPRGLTVVRRSLGATVGISVGQAILSSVCRTRVLDLVVLMLDTSRHCKRKLYTYPTQG